MWPDDNTTVKKKVPFKVNSELETIAAELTRLTGILESSVINAAYSNRRMTNAEKKHASFVADRLIAVAAEIKGLLV